jgi:two-component system alkaline phosphatase synthesis response regulator PhoP
MPSPKILLAESDASRADSIAALLTGAGYEVTRAIPGEEKLDKIAKNESSLLILNATLGERSGLHACRALREAGVDTAILMLAATASAADRVACLKFGADDCLSIPFDPAELLARVQALLRRVAKQNRIPARTFQFEDVEMDFVRSEVRRAGRLVTLAARELDLIRYLVQHRDRVVPREEILVQVWRYSSEVMSRTLDVHIWWLRQKLDDPRRPRHIHTVRGQGYRFTS